MAHKQSKEQTKRQANQQIAEANEANELLLGVHRKRAKALLCKHLPKRVPYPIYLELAELIAAFKVDSGDQSMNVRFS